MAENALRIAEHIHNRLSEEFDWQPQDKTEMVLSDEHDLTNGIATPLPSNRIYLFTTPPTGALGIGDHAGWLETLILHEYVHILHIDKASASPEWLRKIFGRNLLLFPNLLQPSWLIEGLATYYETSEEQGIGRGQSSSFEMMMRMEMKNGIKPLDQVNQHIVSWPAGNTPYLYGVYFFQFIEERYGTNSIKELVENYSSNLIPFRIGSNAESVTGKTLSHLWSDFELYLNDKFQPQLTSIRQSGEIRGQAITQNGYFHSYVTKHPDGRLFYIENDGRSDSALVVQHSDGRIEKISEFHGNARLDLHPAAGIVASQTEVCRNSRMNFDLYHINPDSGEQQRLTHCARYIFASWSPDGKEIIAVHNSLGRHALHLLSASGKLKKILWQGEPGITIAQPDWSPSGNEIAASVWRQDNGWELELFQLSNQKWQRLTFENTIETQPHFTDDGKHLLYSSDHDGIYNIKRLDLTSGETVQISRVSGGAFQPFQASLTTPVYYVGYESRGLDIYKIDKPKGELVSKGVEGPSAEALSEAPKIIISEIEEYSPWSSLKPTSWLPYLNYNSQQFAVGASIWGMDILERHNYGLFASYDSRQQWADYSLAYSYARFDPLLKLYASTSSLAEVDGNNNLTRISRQKEYSAELIYPIVKMDWNLNFHLGSSLLQISDGWLAANEPAYLPLKDTVTGIALSWNSSSLHPKSISPSGGRDIVMLAENSSWLAGDYKGHVYLADWREYIQLGGEHVLALRAALGWGNKSSRSFVLGGINNSTPVSQLNDPTASLFNRRHFSLRGYDTSAALTGRRMQLASAEYRFPISLIERGFMSPPIGLHQLFGHLYTDTGATWDSGSKTGKYYCSAGAELGADLELFYQLPIRLTLGYGYGFDKNIGGNRIYLRLGNSF